LWSHFGWFTCARHFATHYEVIRDFSRYPELVFINRFDWIVPACFMGMLYGIGEWLAVSNPLLQTNGLQMLVWSGAISTVAVYHATFCVNSVCHLIGKRPYTSDDHSRNNWLVALLTFGEGWHNNHHRYPGSARQGFVWWQIDMTYQILRVLQFLRVVKNLKSVPKEVLHEGY
jgi:stearoyl-CoA desaturase (delta-9 desaturase)